MIETYFFCLMRIKYITLKLRKLKKICEIYHSQTMKSPV
ncbi:hypothetical protein EMIT036CA2_80023 [Chryseobacterium sp. IT-36CA2]